MPRGTVLATSFERLDDESFRLLVDDRAAHYPITIDPIAQQAYVKASNTGKGTNLEVPLQSLEILPLSGLGLKTAVRLELAGIRLTISLETLELSMSLSESVGSGSSKPT